MFNAYLSNLVVPDGYDAQKFCKQIVAYGIKNMEFFRDKIHLEGRESIESYFRNIAEGLSAGDRHCLEIMSLMLNTRVTVINPHYDLIKIWHNQIWKILISS